MTRSIESGNTGRRTLAALVAVELVLLAVVLVWKRLDGLDLDVYRNGAEAFFTSGDPYGPLPPTRNGTWLPFTYPPFAAIAFAPLVVLPHGLTLVAITAVGVLALGAVLALTLAPYQPKLLAAGAAVLAVQAVALLSEPVRATLGFGQINLLLMLMVAVDLLAVRRGRGVLLGIAAAVKLTPAAFVLVLLLEKDFKAAGRAAMAFAGCAAAAWLISPSASAHYWTELVFAGERIGDPGYIGNQSLRGMIARFGWEPGAQSLVWQLAVVVVLVVTALVVRRALAGGNRVLAMLACALGALLMSPVSWTHHWVWSGPVVGLLVLLAWRDGNRVRQVVLLALAASSVYVFVDSPLWNHREVWPLRESYVLLGALLLGALAWVARSCRTARAE
ncbi:glycosyltransferase 87 family protein [Amycolatopsis sp. YIM 10]|uniref:glycosyltransferase 87 family protein n=1 Tax=Amycolatopsis sp. YIM 10 TaxID=2653857 RepID=UPI0012AA66C1|nr:glycosyltransferase 87 family protein [Amycolatopsis sp. YIM 10]QFU85978.1 Polyprenol-phosphate-mannose-dependent alpha-(1-2)-phosphatidylinositol mannoside mannosyltransferase [Amycolatopsis sp. YIM 10]